MGKKRAHLYKASPFSFFLPYFPAPTTPERSDSRLRTLKKTAILAVNPLHSAQAILRGRG